MMHLAMANWRFSVLLLSGVIVLCYLWAFPVLNMLSVMEYADGTPLIYMILLPPLLAAIWITVSAANIIDRELSRTISKVQTIGIIILEMMILLSLVVIMSL